MLNQNQREAVSLALVREYLSHHGFHTTLAALTALTEETNSQTTWTKRRLAAKIHLTLTDKQPPAKPKESLIEALVKQKLDEQNIGVGPGPGANPLRPKSAVNTAIRQNGVSPELAPAPRKKQPELMVEEMEDFELEDDGDDCMAGPPGGNVGAGPMLPSYNMPQGSPITVAEALELRQLLFGVASGGLALGLPKGPLGAFQEPWSHQGFCFRDRDTMESCEPSLASGLVQYQGGPCGILAVVQAYIFKNLLYGKSSSEAAPQALLSPSPEVLAEALADALTDILWKAGGNKQAKVAVKGKTDHGLRHKQYRSDGIADFLTIFTCTQKNGLKNLIMNNMKMWMKPNGQGAVGVVVFVYSLLLTRGVATIKKDMDMEGTTLIGSHGYCTQELVNLALQGTACSNVFDGDKTIDESMILRGVQQRSQIGFLTLFEHYEYVKVGSFYKNPEVPIWVLCSESHYSTVFCQHGSQRPTVSDDFGKFDIYFYDELANQTEEFRLTVDYKEVDTLATKDDSPIVHCIRTRWPKCSVDWNGMDPIL